jgi:L-fucose isomerase-like protein
MKKSARKFGFIPVATVLQRQEFNRLIADYIPALDKLGGQQWDAEMISHPAPLFFFVVTGGTEQKILQLREKRKELAPREPAFLLAHPGNNSLPAALEVLARLRQDGERGEIFCLQGPEDTLGWALVAQIALDLEAFHALHQTRIGLVGAPSDWLVASRPDSEVVRKVWGPEVISIDWDELKGSIRSFSDKQIQPPLDSLTLKAREVLEPSKTELEDAVRIYLAIRQLVDKFDLNAITVRCFDLVSQLKTTGCFALAQLNDEGVIAGCEGDLCSTMTMLWVSKRLNRTSWMANPAEIHLGHNSLWLTHCTIPMSLVEDYQLRSHFESGLGLAIQGEMPRGPVTLVRIGGKMLEKLWLAEGEVLQSGFAENLCRTQIEVHLSKGYYVGELLRAPLGNHLVLVPGHHAGCLQRWWRMMISGM